MFFESHIRLNHWIVTKTRTCYFTETYNVYISKQFIVIKVEFTYSYLFPLIIILANDQSPSTFTCTVLSYNLYKRLLYFILFIFSLYIQCRVRWSNIVQSRFNGKSKRKILKLQVIVPLYDSWISFKFRLYNWEIYKWSFIDLCWVQQTRCWQPMTKDWVLLKFYCKLISPRWKLKICFKKKKKLSFFLVRLQVQPIEMSLIPSLTDHNHRLSFSDLMWFIKSIIYTHKFL